MWAYNQTAPDELYHHGIIGMHWGIRRYQNADGSLTTAGRQKYLDGTLNRSPVIQTKPKVRSLTNEQIQRMSKITEKELRDYRYEMMDRYDGNTTKKKFYREHQKQISDWISTKSSNLKR